MAVDTQAGQQRDDERKLAGVKDSAWLLETIESKQAELCVEEDGSHYDCAAGHAMERLGRVQLMLRWRHWDWWLNVCAEHWENGGRYLVRGMSLASIRKALTIGEDR